MRALAIALAATALVAGAAVQAKPKLTPEQRLEKLLDGRVAGKPTSCISTADTRDMEIIDGVALVYRSGTTLYVNRPRNPEDLDSDDILVIRTSGSQLCRLDTWVTSSPIAVTRRPRAKLPPAELGTMPSRTSRLDSLRPCPHLGCIP